MKNEMMLFEKSEFGKLNVLERDGKLWFVAKDLAVVLGYSATGAMSKIIDAEDKFLRSFHNGTTYINQLLINESGLYAAIFGSTLPKAKAFKRWVTDEVLPAIRKTGSYTITRRRARRVEYRKPMRIKLPASALPVEVIPSREDVHKSAADFMLLMDVNYKLGFNRNIAAISANQVTIKLTGVNLLKLLGHTSLLAERQELFFTPTELGTKIGASGQEFNILLRDYGLQEKLDSRWIPTEDGKQYSRIFDVGKRQKHGAAVQQVRWSASVLELFKY